MPDYTAITNASIAPDAPVTAELMTALRDNPAAIAEGAAGAPRLRNGLNSEAATTSTSGFQMFPAITNSLSKSFACLSDGTVRVVSTAVNAPGGNGALSILRNGATIFTATNGQSMNRIVTFNNHDIITIQFGDVFVDSVTFRTERASLSMVPW